MTMWLRRKEYISPEVVKELIKMKGQSLLRQLLGEIRSSLWFSILADEATDISHHEQLSLSIPWVDNCFPIHEETLGLMQLPDTISATIFLVIKDILIRCSLPLSRSVADPEGFQEVPWNPPWLKMYLFTTYK